MDDLFVVEKIWKALQFRKNSERDFISKRNETILMP